LRQHREALLAFASLLDGMDDEFEDIESDGEAWDRGYSKQHVEQGL
jgi:hypothetical protein